MTYSEAQEAANKLSELLKESGISDVRTKCVTGDGGGVYEVYVGTTRRATYPWTI